MREHVLPLPTHARQLLDALSTPEITRTWSQPQWDVAVRSARLARLLGVLAHRVHAAGIDTALPLAIRQQLQGAIAQSNFLVQMLRVELARVESVLQPLGIRVVLLKGAAYLAENLPIAPGRMPNDVDVLVEPAQLAQAEAALRASGWRFDETADDYDQRYYREWSHEIPPLRYAGSVLELDLHHAILPPTTRVSPATALLWPHLRSLGGTPWYVLAPEDQILHMAAHVFIDSDCTSRLRDLVDIDTLLLHRCATEPYFPHTLTARAQELNLAAPLSYALSFIDVWFKHSTAQARVLMQIRKACFTQFKPSAYVLRLASQTLPPHHPDSTPSRQERWATRLLTLRYHFWRMPLGLLIYHSTMKALRGWKNVWKKRKAEPQDF